MKYLIIVTLLVFTASCEDSSPTPCDLFAESVCNVLDYCNQETEPEPGPCQDYFVEVCEISLDLTGEHADPWPDLARCMSNLVDQTLHCPLQGDDLLEACDDFLRLSTESEVTSW